MDNFDFEIKHNLHPGDKSRNDIMFRATNSKKLVSKFIDSFDTLERFKEQGKAFEDAFGVKVNFGIDSRGSMYGFMATSITATDEQVKSLPGKFKRSRGPFLNNFIPVISNHNSQVEFFNKVINNDVFDEMFTIGNVLVFDGFMYEGTLFVLEHKNSRKRSLITNKPLNEVSKDLPLIKKSEFFFEFAKFLESEGW